CPGQPLPLSRSRPISRPPLPSWYNRPRYSTHTLYSIIKANKKSMKFYVTTSIPYVNAEPHVGHAMEFMLADVLARYQRSQGRDVVFATGTDEHGGKVVQAAKAAGVTPKQHTDQLSQNFVKLCKDLDISYDRFIRTTDRVHMAG